MSSAAVHTEMRSGVAQRLLTVPTLTADRVEWEGTIYATDPTKWWAREQMMPIADEPISNGVIGHQVLYVVTLFYPTGKGVADLEKMAGALLDLFKVGTRFSFGSTDVLCMKAERGQIITEPNWVSVRVSATMQANTLD